jgi:polar amino acid transport system permease protein
MLKYTSLASVISVTELLASAELVYTRTFETIPLLIVVSIWYVALTTILTAVQRMLERRVGRSHNDSHAKPTLSFRDTLLQALIGVRHPADTGPS